MGGLLPVALETAGLLPVALETEGLLAVALETVVPLPVALETEGLLTVALETEGLLTVALETTGFSRWCWRQQASCGGAGDSRASRCAAGDSGAWPSDMAVRTAEVLIAARGTPAMAAALGTVDVALAAA
ncbi:UNVERIFIED_CONTAM: hypothetical protein FKN15_054977 [Acipenser sinensis]